VILGIETSCDDTCAAVVTPEGEVRSNVVSSQGLLHARYGGVVPEIASRRHLELLDAVTADALERGGVGLGDVETVAVKAGADRYAARLVPPARAREQIAEAASRAVKSVERFAPYIVPAPYTLAIEWASTAIARSCAVIPGVRPAGPRTTEFTTDDYTEVVGLLGVCATIAGEVGCTGRNYG
jgi:hypothetical protein